MSYPQFFCLIVVSLTIGCGPSIEERASLKINTARMLLEKRDTMAALKQLDSVSVLFPGAIVAMKAAQQLKGELQWDIFHRKQAELDSVNALIERMVTSFIPQKNEWQRYRIYTHLSQDLQQRSSQTFLMAEVDERGDMTLISNFSGGWLGHTRVKVSDGTTEAVTDSIAVGDSFHHQGNFMEARWERITFRDGRDRGVIARIAENGGKKLKITYLGKRNAIVWLEERDQLAIREAYLLSLALKRRQQLSGDISSLQLKY